MERIACDPGTPCNLRDTIGCFEDIHHEAWPKSAYRTKIEKQFREHVMNKVVECRAVHNDEHAQNLPPRKPSREEMLRLMKEYHDEQGRTHGRLAYPADEGAGSAA